MVKKSDRWIPWYFVIFFTVLALILVPLCIVAFRSYSGIVTDSAYEKGLSYNKAIEAAQQQAALGWHSDLSIVPTQQTDEVHADFSLRDAGNKPLDGAVVKLWMIRPAQSGIDQTADLSPQDKGRYGANLKLPAHGVWEARVSVLANNQNYQITKRVVIP